MPLLWEYIEASTQRISKEIQGFAYSGNKSGSCHQEPKILGGVIEELKQEEK